MIIYHVETHCYRNLSNATIELDARHNVLAGDNAQGKTNFLEAVYVAACQRSFRAARTRELIRFGEQQAVVRASALVGQLVRDVEIVLKPEGRRPHIDGKGVRAGSAKLDGLSAVLFSPDDLQVPRGAPSGRRHLLDQAIVAVWPAYHQLQRDYQKTLQSRNRLLKNWAEAAEGNTQLIEVYDTQLAGLGAKVLASRKRYLKAVTPAFTETYREISRSGVDATIRYCCPEELQELEQINDLSDGLLRLMRRQRAQEIARRTTTVGPHTDDLEFCLDGHPARSFGSQGQVRSIVLAFKIIQIKDIFEKQGHFPVLLLDDVSSELDPNRNKYLFDFISNIECQVVVTTTRPELLPVSEKGKCFKVIKGSISQ